MAVKTKRQLLNERLKKITETIPARAAEYGSAFDSVRRSTAAEKHKAKETFLPSSPALKAELSRISAAEQKAIAAAKEKARKGVIDALEDLAIDEEAAVMATPPADIMAELEHIGNLPLTAREFAIIQNKYSGFGYWANKRLAVIAEKNELPSDGLRASFDDRMNVIDQLGNNYTNYLDHYGELQRGTNGYHEAMAAVSADVMQRARDLYTGGAVDLLADDARAVRLTLEKVQAASDNFEAARVLRSAVNGGLSDNARNGLLCAVALDNHFNGVLLSAAGIEKEIKELRADRGAKVKDYYQAQAVADDLTKIKDAAILLHRIEDNKNNDYLIAMLRSSAKDNGVLQAALDQFDTDQGREPAPDATAPTAAEAEAAARDDG